MDTTDNSLCLFASLNESENAKAVGSPSAPREELRDRRRESRSQNDEHLLAKNVNKVVEAAADKLDASAARLLMLKLAERLPDEERRAFRGIVGNNNNADGHSRGRQLQESKSQPAKLECAQQQAKALQQQVDSNHGSRYAPPLRQSKSMNEPRAKYRDQYSSPRPEGRAAAAAAEGVESIAKWDIDRVGAWLAGIGMHEYQQCFADLGVDGRALLRISSQDELETLDVRVRIHRCKILRQIEYLRNPTARKKSPPKKARPRSGPAAGSRAASHATGGKEGKTAGGKAGATRPQLHIETEATAGPIVSGTQGQLPATSMSGRTSPIVSPTQRELPPDANRAGFHSGRGRVVGRVVRSHSSSPSLPSPHANASAGLLPQPVPTPHYSPRANAAVSSPKAAAASAASAARKAASVGSPPNPTKMPRATPIKQQHQHQQQGRGMGGGRGRESRNHRDRHAHMHEMQHKKRVAEMERAQWGRQEASKLARQFAEEQKQQQREKMQQLQQMQQAQQAQQAQQHVTPLPNESRGEMQARARAQAREVARREANELHAGLNDEGRQEQARREQVERLRTGTRRRKSQQQQHSQTQQHTKAHSIISNNDSRNAIYSSTTTDGRNRNSKHNGHYGCGCGGISGERGRGSGEMPLSSSNSGANIHSNSGHGRNGSSSSIGPGDRIAQARVVGDMDLTPKDSAGDGELAGLMTAAKHVSNHTHEHDQHRRHKHQQQQNGIGGGNGVHMQHHREQRQHMMSEEQLRRHNQLCNLDIDKTLDVNDGFASTSNMSGTQYHAAANTQQQMQQMQQMQPTGMMTGTNATITSLGMSGEVPVLDRSQQSIERQQRHQPQGAGGGGRGVGGRGFQRKPISAIGLGMGLRVDVGLGVGGGGDGGGDPQATAMSMRGGIGPSPAEMRPGGMPTLQAPAVGGAEAGAEVGGGAVQHQHGCGKNGSASAAGGANSSTSNNSSNGVPEYKKKNILPLDMGKIDMSVGSADQSFDFTESGTLNVQGFKIAGGGIKGTPFERSGGLDDSLKAKMKNAAGGGGMPPTHNHPKVREMPLNTADCLIQLGELGQGAGGKVYKALYVPTLKIVAVKVIRIHEQAKRRQMIQELKSLYANFRRISEDAISPGTSPCPYLVTFYDAFSDAQRCTVSCVLEYMDAGTLQDLISAGVQCEEPILASIAHSVLSGLAFLHVHKKVHRDVKASNVLISKDGEVKLSDFGLAKDLDNTKEMANTFTGTLLYMSPERIAGGAYSYSSDVWSFGLLLMACAIGRVPLPVEDGYWGVVHAVQQDPSPSLADHTPADFERRGDFSPELIEFVDLTLRKDPEERPGVEELLNHAFIRNNYVSRDKSEMAPAEVTEELEDRVKDLVVQITDWHYNRQKPVDVNASALEQSFRLPKISASNMRRFAEQLGAPYDLVKATFDEYQNPLALAGYDTQ